MILIPIHTRGSNAREHSERELLRMRGLKRTNPWTEAELAMLREAYAVDRPASEINLPGLERRLGRLKSNICRKARELGLTNQQRPKIDPKNKKIRGPRFATAKERSAHVSATRKAWIAANGHPRGALGMRHTAETKAMIAKKSRARWESLTQEQRDAHVFNQVKSKRDKGTPFPNPRGTWKAGWREIGGQRHFFRSRWEANYGRYLEWLRRLGEIQAWDHEAHVFWFEGIRRGVVSYLPDFKVIERNGSIQWHEVKGWMDGRSKTALARMAKYHPHETLIVIREQQYMEIQRKVGGLIDGWESS